MFDPGNSIEHVHEGKSLRTKPRDVNPSVTRKGKLLGIVCLMAVAYPRLSATRR